MRRTILMAAVPAIVAACGPDASQPTAADIEAQLLKVDRAFARAAAERGADGWADFFADSGVMFPPSGMVEGRERIREAMRPTFEPGRPPLRWEPARAVAAASGDLGYTIGRWRMVVEEAGADSAVAAGHYVTIWRRQPDGSWRVAVDIGNEDTVPP